MMHAVIYWAPHSTGRERGDWRMNRRLSLPIFENSLSPEFLLLQDEILHDATHGDSNRSQLSILL